RPPLQHLFHCYALREIPWLVDVAAEVHGRVIRKELERDRREDGREKIGALGYPDEIVRNLFQFAAALGADRDDRTLACFYFLDVGDVFLEHTVLRRDEDAGQLGRDQRNDSVL